MKPAALLLMLCASLAAQPASVEGTVVNRTNGQPMSGVHVRLILGESTDSPEAYGATSNEAGHFSFPQLKPGSYLTLADRVGFFQMQPKGNKTAGVYTTIKPGEPLTDLKLEMAARAVITGHVLDDNGDPLGNCYVQLMPVPPDTAVQPLGRGPYVTLDARGEYRIATPPGKYYVVATVFNMMVGGAPEIRTDGTSEVAYGTTYYPNSAAKDQATGVEATAGSDVAGIDIHLVHAAPPARPMTIGGTVTGVPDGIGRTEILLMAGTAGLPRRPAGSIYAGLDGGSWSTRLPPGLYQVFARYAAAKTPLLSEPVEVRLDSVDVTNVLLVLGTGGELTGSLKVAGGAPTAAPGARYRVTLEPTDYSYYGPVAPADVDQDGAFHLVGVLPGNYRVNVAPLPEDAYLSVTLDGNSAGSGWLDLTRGARGGQLKITVGHKGGRISGKVLDKDGTPAVRRVAIFLGDDAKELADRSLTFATDGTYSFKAIGPGKHRLLAFDTFQLTGSLYDLPFAQALFALGEEVEIKEGDRLTKELKLVAAEDVHAK
jgi:hypothetical protein